MTLSQGRLFEEDLPQQLETCFWRRMEKLIRSLKVKMIDLRKPFDLAVEEGQIAKSGRVMEPASIGISRTQLAI